MSGNGAALVRVAWVPVRVEPDRRAEMVSQWLSGEVLVVEEEGPERWLRARGPGAYRGWVDAGGLVRTDRDGAEDWRSRARCFVLGTDLAPAPGERAGPPPPRWLPWGGRVVRHEDGRVEVAGGARVRPVEPAAVVGDRGDRFPRTGEAVVRTAWRWLGVPYLWGGRIREGVDCSGLVQAVFAAHRIGLPRDSGPQREATATDPGGDGPPLEGDAGELVFFGAAEGETDHVALRVGGTRVLHAAAGNGQVAEDDLAGGDAMGRRLRDRLRAVGRPLEGEETA